MTVNGGIALILHYSIEFDSFGGQLRQWLKIDLWLQIYPLPRIIAPALCDS